MGKYTATLKKKQQVGINLGLKANKIGRIKKTQGKGKGVGTTARPKKLSEYGKQLQEKQKVKLIYGVLEKQFRRFFDIASRQTGVTGEVLLGLLERRLDNVVFRLKMGLSRSQARQMIVHGHVNVNGKRVRTPSYIIGEGDKITLSEKALKKTNFLEVVVDKRINMGIRVPEWLELQKKERQGIVLRLPVRSDITELIEEHLIVELYSK